MSKQIQIRIMQKKDIPFWDEYVDKHAQGTFFHLTGWFNVISSVFRHQPYYLLAQQHETGQIVGILPLFEQKSKIFGHALVSTPFCVYGGVVADSDAIKKQLEKKAYELGCILKVDYIELRDKELSTLENPWVNHCHHSTFSSVIGDNSDEILTKIKRKQRAVIRHSLKNKLSWDTEDNIDTCYDIYSESVRNLGTPVFDRKLFQALKKEFSSRCETLVIHDQNKKVVSSVLSFYYKNTVIPYYGGGNHDARDLKSNDYMYYQLMCLAKEKGFSHFDFGRSKKDSGSYKYKKHWGMKEQELHYRIALVNAKALPNLSPNNPKYKTFIKVWKKLPLAISRQIGPQISKYLG